MLTADYVGNDHYHLQGKGTLSGIVMGLETVRLLAPEASKGKGRELPQPRRESYGVAPCRRAVTFS